MALISQTTIDSVRQAVDMVDLVSAYTDMKQQGRRYIGLCPFHDERTPSFSVDPHEKVYYCFGCEAGGDAFRFLQEKEGLDFGEAVEQLADRFGVSIEFEQEAAGGAERRKSRERLLELLEHTTEFYVRCFWESQEASRAREYLESRGLKEDILKQFRVGYAPSAWDSVLTRAAQRGYTEDELRGAGLLVNGKKGGAYDRFRSRIIFPLADSRGRVLGFGARALRDNQQPKYMNSPDGPLYHKGSLLFGLHQSRKASAEANEIVVVEGYTDVLAMHQVGMCNSVAIMGTALTTQQVTELTRLAGSVTFALDADRAGQEAMLRALELARDRDIELKVLRLPDDNDPCDLLMAGDREDFERRLKEAVSLLAFQVERVLEKHELDTARGRDRALSELIPIFEKVSPSAERDEQLRHVSGRLDLSQELLASLSSRRGPAGVAKEISVGPATRREAAERTFLAMCLGLGEEGRVYLERLTERHLSSDLLKKARDAIYRDFDEPTAAVDPDDRDTVALVSELVIRSADEPATVAKLEAGFLGLELRRLEAEISELKEKGDFERMDELARERQKVKEAIVTATEAAL